MKKELKPFEKRRLLADIVQWSVGYNCDDYVGRPLSWYNWDAVIKLHEIKKKESEED